jgi:hypothetical protein
MQVLSYEKQQRFRFLGLPDEILELPPIFHPSRASEFFEFSENCWKMCENIYSTNCNKQFFKKRRKSTFIVKKQVFFGGFFQEFSFISYSKNSRKLFDQIL